MKKRFQILLHPNAPQQILEIFAPYLHDFKGMNFLLSLSLEYGDFVQLEVVKDNIDKPWRVAIALQHILAVSQSDEGSPLGF